MKCKVVELFLLAMINNIKKDGYRQRNVRQFLQSAKAHYLATSRESRRYVVAFRRIAAGDIWLRQESLRHLLASPGQSHGNCYADGNRI